MHMSIPASEPPTGAQTPKSSPPWGFLFSLFILTIYFLLAIGLTYPLAENLGGRIPMPVYIHDRPWVHTLWTNLWWLWHVKYAVLTLHQIPFSTDLIFYPIGIPSALPYFFQSVYPALLFMPLAALFPVVTAGNLLLIFSISLSGYTAFLLGRYLLEDNRAAFVAGLAFAFACPQLANAQGHLMMVTAVPLIPLFLLFLVKLREEDAPRNVYLVSLVSILLFFSYWYLLVFVSMFSLVYLLTRPFSPKALLRLLKSILLTLLALVPMILLIWSQHGADFSASLRQAQGWSVDLLAFFLPSHDHTFFGDWTRPIRETFRANPTIQSAYLGYPVFGLALIGVRRRSWRKWLPWTLGFVLFFILALGPRLHVHGESIFHLWGKTFSVPLPFVLFHKLPILNAIRDLSMFLMMSSLCLSVLAGYGVRSLLRKAAQPSVIYTAVVGVILLDCLMIPFPTVPVHIPAVYEVLKQTPGQGTVAEVPMRPEMASYLFYQTYHKKPLLDCAFSRMTESYAAYGDTGPFLPVLTQPKRLLHGSWSDHTLRQSAQWAARFFDLDAIVVHKDLMTPGEWKALNRFFRQTVGIRGIMDVGDPAVLFRLDRPPLSPQADILIDFGAPPPQFYLSKGWSSPEQWEDACRFRWSDRPASDLYVDVGPSGPLRALLRMRPFSYPGAPQQTVEIFCNGAPVHTVILAPDEWKTYPVDIPAEAVRQGVNHLRFVYGHTQRPADILSHSRDRRRLAVAFDTLEILSSREDF